MLEAQLVRDPTIPLPDWTKPNFMKVVSYVPHGAVPDLRGNAPAIVAQCIARNLAFCESSIICNTESYRSGSELNDTYGSIYRLREVRFLRKFHPLHRRAAAIARRVGADVVHAHQLEFPVDDFRARLSVQPKIVVHMHVFRTFQPQLGLADRYVAPSAYARERLVAERGYPADLVDVVPSGTDTALFQPPHESERLRLRQAVGIPADAVVISYVGRKVSSKGFLAFLLSVRHLLATFPNVYAIAAGMTPSDFAKDEHRVEIEHLVRELKTRSRFFDLPPLRHGQLASLYKITDIVHFATYFRDETFGLVALEAQSCGCVLLASRHGPLPEIVQDRVTGYLVDDPTRNDTVVDMTDYLVRHIETMRPLREAARRWASAHFDWKITASRVENLYFSLVGQSQTTLVSHPNQGSVT
jgi:glycosyltransferase involved in cell wall biosynthesis